MGEIKDAIETIHDLKTDFAEAGIYATKRSISASAMEGTANFPVLVEDSISLDDGILISRALEKKYASFLLTVLTMDPYLEVEKGVTPSASQYLRQFHQNIRVKDSNKGLHMNLIDFMNESYDVGMEYDTMESEAFKMVHAIYEGVRGSIPENKNVLLNYTIGDVTESESLNSKFSVMEANKQPQTINVTLANNGDFSTPHVDNVTQNTFNDVQNADIEHAGSVKMGDTHTHVHVNTKDGNKDTAPKVNVRDRGSQWKVLTDNDCKKANDLVPTLLHIRVYPIDKYTREELTPIDFIMGVKATLHPIPVSELARMVVTGMRNENMLFNFIRWTTGEIKFFKDFVFAIDTLKADAKDTGRDVTGWRPALKRRRKHSRAKLRFTKHSILPNATLVVSQGAIDFIKESYGYDLENERIIRRLMTVYFLLGYVSVNTVNQRATFMFDGIESTDTYTFDTLKRENQSDDKAFKNMMKMLGRSM